MSVAQPASSCSDRLRTCRKLSWCVSQPRPSPSATSTNGTPRSTSRRASRQPWPNRPGPYWRRTSSGSADRSNAARTSGRIMSAALRYSAWWASKDAAAAALEELSLERVPQLHPARGLAWRRRPPAARGRRASSRPTAAGWLFAAAAGGVPPTSAGAYAWPRKPGPNAAGLICSCGATLT